MKRYLVLLLALCLLFSVSRPAQALDTELHVYDYADLLAAEEEAELAAEMDQLIEKLQLDIAIVTTDNVYGMSAMDYADAFYEDNGFGYGDSWDGLLLLVAMDIREYWTTTDGAAISMFGEREIDYIHEEMAGNLSDGRYAEAFFAYLEAVEAVASASAGKQVYDGDSAYPSEYYSGTVIYYTQSPWQRAISALPVILIAALIVSLIIVFSMAKKNRMVQQAVAANQYVNNDSLNLRVNTDIYLRSHTVTVKVATEKHPGGGGGIHRSSSGRMHGGGGGRF